MLASSPAKAEGKGKASADSNDLFSDLFDSPEQPENTSANPFDEPSSQPVSRSTLNPFDEPASQQLSNTTLNPFDEPAAAHSQPQSCKFSIS